MTSAEQKNRQSDIALHAACRLEAEKAVPGFVAHARAFEQERQRYTTAYASTLYILRSLRAEARRQERAEKCAQHREAQREQARRRSSGKRPRKASRTILQRIVTFLKELV